MENQPDLLTETGEAYEITEDGSLGLLALGYSGIMLWRQKRRELQEQRLKEQQKNQKND